MAVAAVVSEKAHLPTALQPGHRRHSKEVQAAQKLTNATAPVTVCTITIGGKLRLAFSQ
jgi:hypothetical protein